MRSELVGKGKYKDRGEPIGEHYSLQFVVECSSELQPLKS